MDKTLFKAYVRTIVEEQVSKIVKEEISELLPTMLDEAISRLAKKKPMNESVAAPNAPVKPKISKERIRELLGAEFDGETLHATTESMIMAPPTTAELTDGQKEVYDAINKDYRGVMKAMGL